VIIGGLLARRVPKIIARAPTAIIAISKMTLTAASTISFVVKFPGDRFCEPILEEQKYIIYHLVMFMQIHLL